MSNYDPYNYAKQFLKKSNIVLTFISDDITSAVSSNLATGEPEDAKKLHQVSLLASGEPDDGNKLHKEESSRVTHGA